MKNALVLVFLTITFYSYSQILNVEKRRGNHNKNGWSGNIDFALKYTKNTREIFELSNRSIVNYKKDLKDYLIISDFKIIKQNNNDLINKGVLHLRYIKQLKDSVNISYEAFIQTQFNAVQKIKQRSLLGGGYRFKLLGNDSINLNLGTGIMYEYEASIIDTYFNAVRATGYLSFNWNIGKSWSVKTISYYQPKIDDWNDYRFSNESSVSYRFSKQFSIVGIFNGLFDSSPIDGVPNQIITTSLLFRYVF